MNPMRFVAVVAACVSLLSGCGGGGGGGGGSNPPPPPKGAFTLTGNSASFSAIQGLPAPAAKSVTMTVTGSGVAGVGAAYGAGQTPASWLSIGMSGTGPYTLTVQPIPGAVAPGTYTATFLVGTGDADGNILRTQNFTVTYTLEPQLSADIGGISRHYVFGAASRVETVSLNISAPNRQWTIVSNAPWLGAPADTKTGSSAVDATINVTGLAPGTYSGMLTVANSEAAMDAASINVSVTIDPANFEVAQSEFTFGGEDGRDEITAQQLGFTLATGDGLHPYTVAITTDSGGPWLTVDHESGNVGAAGASVSLGVDAGDLAGGTYTGTVLVSTNVYGTVFSESLPVTLNIEAHRITVSAAGVALSRVAGREVLTRKLEVYSNLDVPTQWTATSDSPWLTVTPSGATGDDLVLTATPGTLSLDTSHFAIVTITSPDADVENTESVRVGLYLSDTAPVDEVMQLYAISVAASPVEPLYAVAVDNDVQLRNAYSNALVRTYDDVVVEPGQMAFSADGLSLFVHDLANLRVAELDLASGTVPRTFEAPVNPYSQDPGLGIAVIRPQGYATLVTPNTHFYDLATGQEVDVGPWSFWGFDSFVPSPDQTLLAHEQGGASRLERTALNGGGIVIEPSYFSITQETYSRESCFSPDGDILYTGAHDVGPYMVAGVSIATRQLVKRLPAEWWGSALQCSWNGLIVGAQSSGSQLFDIYVYDGPSETVLGQRNSDLSDGTYYPNRSVQDRGMTISADGTRLLSVFRTQQSLSWGISLQSLPTPP